MYKVRKNSYQYHTDASKAAKEKSCIIPVFLRAPSGGAWYWRGRYCGRHIWELFNNLTKPYKGV